MLACEDTGMLKLLALLGGLAGAAGLSQYPEFAQQYLQRLAGQVDALEAVVADFDASAARAGLNREQALAELTGTAFLRGRQDDMRRTFERHDRLSGDLDRLRAASPFERMAMPQRLADPQTFGATWADFRPAVPVTAEGAVAAILGYLGGWLLVTAVVGLLVWPFRRSRRLT